MKILMTDFDGTLLLGGKYPDELVQAVADWHKAGNILVISTARCLRSVARTVETYNIDCDYIVSDCGSEIYGKDLTLLSSNVPDKKEMLDLLRRMAGMGMERVYVSDGNIAYAIDENGNYRAKETPTSLEEIDSVIERPAGIHMRFKDADVCKAICDELNGDKHGHFTARQSGGNNALVIKRGNDKAVGGYKLLRIVGGKKEDIYAIGDGSADIPMVKEFNGYAIAGSLQEVTDAAQRQYGTVTQLIRDVLAEE